MFRLRARYLGRQWQMSFILISFCRNVFIAAENFNLRQKCLDTCSFFLRLRCKSFRMLIFPSPPPPPPLLYNVVPRPQTLCHKKKTLLGGSGVGVWNKVTYTQNLVFVLNKIRRWGSTWMCLGRLGVACCGGLHFPYVNVLFGQLTPH